MCATTRFAFTWLKSKPYTKSFIKFDNKVLTRYAYRLEGKKTET